MAFAVPQEPRASGMLVAASGFCLDHVEDPVKISLASTKCGLEDADATTDEGSAPSSATSDAEATSDASARERCSASSRKSPRRRCLATVPPRPAGAPPGLAACGGVRDASGRAARRGTAAPTAKASGAPLLATGGRCATRPERQDASRREATLVPAGATAAALLPAKVWLPQEAGSRPKLDPDLPAKKYPAYAEFADPAVVRALQDLKATEPVKKRMPRFLLASVGLKPSLTQPRKEQQQIAPR